MTCARPSCDNVVWVDELCSDCKRAEDHARFCIDFDRLASLDELYPEHRERHDRPKKLSLPVRLVKVGDDHRGTRYGLAALRNIIVRLSDRSDRNNGFFFAARCAGELVAGGQLDGKYALDTLLEAAELLAPDERWKSKDTIARGMRVGLEKPREPRTDRRAA